MKKIIILEKTNMQNYQTVSCLFWLAIPHLQRPVYANPGAVSLYKQTTPEELQMIKDGLVIEMQKTLSFSEDTTLDQIKAKLLADYNTEQSNIETETKYDYYGTSWDGTSWS